jgi:hypothetical protein
MIGDVYVWAAVPCAIQGHRAAAAPQPPDEVVVSNAFMMTTRWQPNLGIEMKASCEDRNLAGPLIAQSPRLYNLLRGL